MGVNYYIANTRNRTYIELDKGSWSWIIEYLHEFMDVDTKIEDLDNLLKNSINLRWKADEDDIISYWRNKIRNFLMGESQDNIYLVLDDTWIKCDRSHGFVEDMDPPFWLYSGDNYTEIK